MTLGKLFTYWGVLGHTFDTEILYTSLEGKGVGPDKPKKHVKHVKVQADTPGACCVAHIIYRSKVNGSVGAMLQADIYFNGTSNHEFIPNATLVQLETHII
jgi:hypothetical protein